MQDISLLIIGGLYKICCMVVPCLSKINSKYPTNVDLLFDAFGIYGFIIPCVQFVHWDWGLYQHYSGLTETL